MGSHNLEFCMGAVPTVFPQVSHENGMKIFNNPAVNKGMVIQSNPLKGIVLGPDYEHPLIRVLYVTLCLNRTRQLISIYAGYPVKRYTPAKVWVMWEYNHTCRTCASTLMPPVSMATTLTPCCQIICQKSTTVRSSGAWVAMYHNSSLPTFTCQWQQHPLNSFFSETNSVLRYKKPLLILPRQEMMGFWDDCGISWTTLKQSAPFFRHTLCPNWSDAKI